MTNMPNAPLVYTLGVVRFPRIPKLGRFADGLHDLIRRDYPLFDEIKLLVRSVKFGPAGEVEVEVAEPKMLQFANHDRTWAFLLTEEIFGLHTSAYMDHIDFIRRFEFGLRSLLAVPEIGLSWIEAVGLRYVDLVIPHESECLSEYLKDWVLPPGAPDMTFREGTYIASYDTSVGGTLRFQALRNPPATLPPDLNTPFIERNNWKHDRSTEDFAVMDMDHGCRFDPPVPMNVDMIGKKFAELRGVTSQLFLRTGTEHAMRIWRGES